VQTAVEVKTTGQVDSGEMPDVQVDSDLPPAAEPSYDGYAAEEAPAAGWQVWGLGLALLLFVVSVVGLGILWRRKM
jgi:hypothetical protein